MNNIEMEFYRYEETKRDVTKWTPIVRANREAPTLVFTAPRNDVPRTTTTAALTSKFQPSSGGMEAEVAAMLTAAGISSDRGVEDAEEALALQVLQLPPPPYALPIPNPFDFAAYLLTWQNVSYLL